MATQNDSHTFGENVHPNLAAERNSISLHKTIVYLDRNNTPDIWGDIKRTVDQSILRAGG